jgi:DNA polymerase epsilon subunit 1
VVQVVETDEPGVMRVWALVAGDLHCMKVQCYRQFFVNMRVPDASGSRRRVFRSLPRARPCLNLYEFVLTEREYLDNQRQFSSYFAHPDVEGVYERQVRKSPSPNYV